MEPSKNAVAQALKIVKPEIGMKELFRLLDVPEVMTTRYRYWKETYNIKPWAQRSLEEQEIALQTARKLLAEG
jgi:hypothetical protein